MDQCRSALKDLSAHPLTAASVARVIGMMTRHPSATMDHTSLQASLNWTVFRKFLTAFALLQSFSEENSGTLSVGYELISVND